MFQKRKLEDIEREFRARAPRYIAVSDHNGLRTLFSRLSAYAGMTEGEARSGCWRMASIMISSSRGNGMSSC